MGMIIMNGKEYTSTPKDGFPPIIYSDEEREVGVWRDGKPLYQKTLTVSITSKVQWIETNIDTDSLIVDTKGVLVTPNLTNGLILLPNGDPSGLVGIGTIFKDVLSTGTFSLLYHTTSDSLGSGTAYITLWYTKSSDVAGSGKYTTYGGISHHYSKNEQVVGTWIDGKPIYECSWEFSSALSIPPATWTDSPITVSSKSIKTIVGCGAVSGDGDIWGCVSASANNGTSTYVQLYSTRPTYSVSIKYLTLRYTKTTD